MKLVDELNEVLKEKEKVNAEGVLLNKEAKGKVSKMIQDLTSYKLNHNIAPLFEFWKDLSSFLLFKQ